MQEGGRAVSEESEPPPPPPSASRLNPALPLLLEPLSLPPPPLRTRGPCTPGPTWALTFLPLWPGLPQAGRSAPCPYARAARRRPSASPGGQGLLAAVETAGGGGRDHALAAEGSPDPSPHIKRYNVSFYGEAAPYMVSPCAPAPLVGGSGTSAPHWPIGGAYLHRHTELAAVIPRQTATPKREEPTSLKGTEEERRLRPLDQRMVERIGRNLRRGSLGGDRSAVLRSRGSSSGNPGLKGLEANTGVVPGRIVLVAVNDIIQPKFQGSAKTGALIHPFLREPKLLPEQRGLESPVSRFVLPLPLGSNSSPPPDFLSLSLSSRRRHVPTRPAPRSSFIILYTECGGGGVFGRRTSGKDRRRQSASRSPRGAGRRDGDQ